MRKRMRFILTRVSAREASSRPGAPAPARQAWAGAGAGSGRAPSGQAGGRPPRAPRRRVRRGRGLGGALGRGVDLEEPPTSTGIHLREVLRIAPAMGVRTSTPPCPSR